jgi:chromosome partitioning protein
MSKIIAILNQKGGAGKTTLATNLARALQKADNESVLLVDSDPQGSARDSLIISTRSSHAQIS